MSSIIDNNKIRIPVIALPYSEKHKAVCKELMVDYDTGNIYVVSATDKSVIFDITSKIKEKIDSISGDKIEVEIEGIGKVVLNDILNKLRLDLSNSVQVIETGEDVDYVGKDSVLDNVSVRNKDNNIEVAGFSDARELSFLRKRNGVAEWVTLDDLFLNNDGSINNILGGIINNNPGTGTGTGGTITPGNPDDGGILSCIIQQPTNGKIFLKASKRQKSKNIAENCIVYLPTILDEYSEIQWYVVTNSFAPELRFFGNIVWKNNVRLLSKNSHHLISFMTFDHGDTWLGEIVCYDAEISETGAIDKSYLEQHYYDKNYLDSSFISTEFLSNHYPDNDTITNNYYSKDDMDEKYYNKTDINEFLEFKNKQ